MNPLEGALIELLNWEKYNPRKDIKSTSWLRLQNTLFEDPSFFDLSHSEILFWIYLWKLRFAGIDFHNNGVSMSNAWIDIPNPHGILTGKYQPNSDRFITLIGECRFGQL